MIQQDIENLIKKHYKRAIVDKVSIFGLDSDYVIIRGSFGKQEAYVALRILRKYPQIRAVHFTGAWLEGFYSRETLRWGGYKI